MATTTKEATESQYWKKELDWDSDDDSAIDVEERDKKYPFSWIQVLGFHPYRDIVLFCMSDMVVAYYFSSSKVQDLGELRINKHRSQIIREAFMYTPCWVGELSENS